MHAGAMVGQGNAGAVPPDRQVLVETEAQTSQPNLNRLCPGERTSPPGVIFYQNLGDKRDIQVKLHLILQYFSNKHIMLKKSSIKEQYP